MIPISFLKAAGVTDIRKDVQVLSGTSIGGIAALYLASGRSASNLYDDFLVEAYKIFSKSFWRSMNPFLSKYPETGINQSLQTMLPGILRDISGIYTVIPTLNFKEECPKVYDNIVDDDDMDELLWEIGRRTSAAPTYFPPHGHDIYLDGGVIENSPIITTATTIRDKLKVDFSEMEVLVLGTGWTVGEDKKLEDVMTYGHLDWVTKFLVPYVTKSNEIASEFWGKHLGFKYFRTYNPVYIGQSPNMDDLKMLSGKNSLQSKVKEREAEFINIWKEFCENR